MTFILDASAPESGLLTSQRGKSISYMLTTSKAQLTLMYIARCGQKSFSYAVKETGNRRPQKKKKSENKTANLALKKIALDSA